MTETQEYTKNKIDEIKRVLLDHMDMAKQEFDEHRDKKVQGKMGMSPQQKKGNSRPRSCSTHRVPRQ